MPVNLQSYFQKGSTWDSYADLKTKVIQTCLEKRWAFVHVRKDSGRWRIECVKRTCDFYVSFSRVKAGPRWHVASSNPKHTCYGASPAAIERVVTTWWLGRVFSQHEAFGPHKTAKDIRRAAEKAWHIDLGKDKAKGAIKLVKEHYWGKHDDGVKEVPKYLLALAKANPGSYHVCTSTPTTRMMQFS